MGHGQPQPVEEEEEELTDEVVEEPPHHGQPRFSLSTGLATTSEAKASELATKAYFILTGVNGILQRKMDPEVVLYLFSITIGLWRVDSDRSISSSVGRRRG